MKQNWDSWSSNCTGRGTYLAFFQTVHFASVCPVVSAGEGRKWCHVHQHPYGHPHSVATKSSTVNNTKITKTANQLRESWSSFSFKGNKLVNILPYSFPLKVNKNVEFNCETQIKVYIPWTFCPPSVFGELWWYTGELVLSDWITVAIQGKLLSANFLLGFQHGSNTWKCQSWTHMNQN